ncbi:MAG: T9SS type A sorting domain-containing protein, partial [Crocinitomicaceae bacterium]|nr:T9SS type A sorting domain-containing protein [Crocinitomicaceae bacterium]
YDALGNNGTCYNQDLTNCTSVGNVPDSIISALYYCSDHLPVVFSLQSDVDLSVSENYLSETSIYPNPTSSKITISNSSNDNIRAVLSDLKGKIISSTEFLNEISLDLAELKMGVYLMSIYRDDELIEQERIIRN